MLSTNHTELLDGVTKKEITHLPCAVGIQGGSEPLMFGFCVYMYFPGDMIDLFLDGQLTRR